MYYGGRKNAYNILVVEHRGNRPCGDKGVNGKISKCILEKQGMEVGGGFSGFRTALWWAFVNTVINF
jgi:hypothetical protein